MRLDIADEYAGIYTCFAQPDRFAISKGAGHHQIRSINGCGIAILIGIADLQEYRIARVHGIGIGQCQQLRCIH